MTLFQPCRDKCFFRYDDMLCCMATRHVFSFDKDGVSASCFVFRVCPSYVLVLVSIPPPCCYFVFPLLLWCLLLPLLPLLPLFLLLLLLLLVLMLILILLLLPRIVFFRFFFLYIFVFFFTKRRNMFYWVFTCGVRAQVFFTCLFSHAGGPSPIPPGCRSSCHLPV